MVPPPERASASAAYGATAIAKDAPMVPATDNRLLKGAGWLTWLSRRGRYSTRPGSQNAGAYSGEGARGAVSS